MLVKSLKAMLDKIGDNRIVDIDGDKDIRFFKTQRAEQEENYFAYISTENWILMIEDPESLKFVEWK